MFGENAYAGHKPNDDENNVVVATGRLFRSTNNAETNDISTVDLNKIPDQHKMI